MSDSVEESRCALVLYPVPSAVSPPTTRYDSCSSGRSVSSLSEVDIEVESVHEYDLDQPVSEDYKEKGSEIFRTCQSLPESGAYREVILDERRPARASDEKCEAQRSRSSIANRQGQRVSLSGEKSSHRTETARLQLVLGAQELFSAPKEEQEDPEDHVEDEEHKRREEYQDCEDNEEREVHEEHEEDQEYNEDGEQNERASRHSREAHGDCKEGLCRELDTLESQYHQPAVDSDTEDAENEHPSSGRATSGEQVRTERQFPDLVNEARDVQSSRSTERSQSRGHECDGSHEVIMEAPQSQHHFEEQSQTMAAADTPRDRIMDRESFDIDDLLRRVREVQEYLEGQDVETVDVRPVRTQNFSEEQNPGAANFRRVRSVRFSDNTRTQQEAVERRCRLNRRRQEDLPEWILRGLQFFTGVNVRGRRRRFVKWRARPRDDDSQRRRARREN